MKEIGFDKMGSRMKVFSALQRLLQAAEARGLTLEPDLSPSQRDERAALIAALAAGEPGTGGPARAAVGSSVAPASGAERREWPRDPP